MEDSHKLKIRALLDAAKTAFLAADEESELHYRKQLVDLDPLNARSLRGYGAACLMHERMEETLQTLEVLKSIPAARRDYRELKVDYLIDTEAVDELSTLLDEWFTLDPVANADAFSLTVKAWTNLGDDGLLEKLRRHCRLSKADFFRDAVGLYFHFKTPPDIQWSNHQVSTDPNQLVWFVNFVESLLDHGYYEQALATAVPMRKALRNAPLSDPAIRRSLDETISIGEYLLEHQSRAHALIKEDYSSDLLKSPVRAPNKIAFVFTGLNGRAMVGNRILDFYLAQLGYQSVFLRDLHRSGFSKGVQSLGKSREDTIRFIKSLCDTHQCNDPLFIGTSIGTFGAISHGVPMGASRFLLFGPVTAAGDKPTLMKLGDFRIPSVLIRCKREIPDGERRMQDFIGAADQDLNIKVVFNEDDALDGRFAQTLEGSRGVSLIANPDAGSHNALRATLAQGRFASLIER